MDYKQHKGNLRGKIKDQVERKLYNKRIRAEAINVDTSEGQLTIPVIINWVSVTERMPEEEWGDYMVCLENNAILIANYSRIGTERWLRVGIGEIKNTNPVKYWAELPESPCLYTVL